MSAQQHPSLSTWEIQWCDTFECDGPATEDPDEPGTCDECAQPLVRVEVVRADAARAADGLRDQIASTSQSSALPGPRALAAARAENDKLRAELETLRDLRVAAEALILSRAGWERWGHDSFLYDRLKGFGTGTVYSTADALRKLTRPRR